MPATKRQVKLKKYLVVVQDETESPLTRLRAARRLLETGEFSRRTTGHARRLCNRLIGDSQMSDEIRDAAVKLLRDVAIGEAGRKNSLLARIKVGDVVFQDGTPFRVTETSNGRVVAAEPIQEKANVSTDLQPEQVV